MIDKSQSELAQRAALTLENLTDLARDLRDYLDGIEFNPKRLEQVEERLDLIHRLQKKYGGTIESAIAFGIQARKDLETITNAAEKIGELEAKEDEPCSRHCPNRRRHFQRNGRLLPTNCRKASRANSTISRWPPHVSAPISRPGPTPTAFPSQTETWSGSTATGFDRVEFLVAPNPGEGSETACQDRLGR